MQDCQGPGTLLPSMPVRIASTDCCDLCARHRVWGAKIMQLGRGQLLNTMLREQYSSLLLRGNLTALAADIHHLGHCCNPHRATRTALLQRTQ